MTTRGGRQLEKNRDKVVQDRIQLLLTRLLQDEDNKYCIDCDSKGPRWASWNIGIFLCIRCAGIHRNLGVHISKVKSVNLDSWTPQQVASMQLMGNSKGRAVYEAGLSEDVLRPQSDAALETFIRAKYEKKKYIAKEWTPTKPPELPLGWAEIIEAAKQKKDVRTLVLPSRTVSSISPSNNLAQNPRTSDVTTVPPKQRESEHEQKKANAKDARSTSEDLFGLMTNGTEGRASVLLPPAPLSSQFDLLSLGGNLTTDVCSNTNLDFNDFVGASSAPSCASKEPTAAAAAKGLDSLEFDGHLSFQTSAVPTTTGSNQMSKDSIMALFNMPHSQTQHKQNQAVAGPGIPPHQNFGTPLGGAGINKFQQQQQNTGLNFMNPQTQSNHPFGVSAQPTVPPATIVDDPFLSNTVKASDTCDTKNAGAPPFLQVDLGFGAMGAASGKSQSWGFAQ